MIEVENKSTNVINEDEEPGINRPRRR